MEGNLKTLWIFVSRKQVDFSRKRGTSFSTRFEVYPAESDNNKQHRRQASYPKDKAKRGDERRVLVSLLVDYHGSEGGSELNSDFDEVKDVYDAVVV